MAGPSLPTPIPIHNNVMRYYEWVLRSFRDKDTQAVWERRRSRKLDPVTQRAALRKLAILDAAEKLGDLLIPPGQQAGEALGRQGRSTQHPDQLAVAELLPLV
jgi:plasmid maintenance system killer protein